PIRLLRPDKPSVPRPKPVWSPLEPLRIDDDDEPPEPEAVRRALAIKSCAVIGAWFCWFCAALNCCCRFCWFWLPYWFIALMAARSPASMLGDAIAAFSALA